MYIIKGKTTDWELVIGLEVHCEIISESKVFSGAPVLFGGEQNTQANFVDAAFPGMLPVLNEKCVEQCVKTGIGLNATINKYSRFDRKNYFYPDLPKAYQISQLISLFAKMDTWTPSWMKKGILNASGSPASTLRRMPES